MHVKFVTSNVIGKLEKWDDTIILYKTEVEIMQSRYEATLLAYMHVYSYIYGCGKMNILSTYTLNGNTGMEHVYMREKKEMSSFV